MKLTRVCQKCGQTKPLNEFHKDRRSTGGRRWDCKSCRRSQHSEYEYGLSRKTFNALWAIQHGLCAICKTPLGKTERPQVDHCHTSEAIRGLLCKACNHGLGKFRDSQKFLRGAIRYLRNPPAQFLTRLEQEEI